MRSLILALVLILAPSARANAQGSGTVLPTTARAGDRITVVTTNGARFSGRLVTDGAGTLVVRSRGGEQRISHLDLARVDRHRNRFFLGPLIGLGVGLAIGTPLQARFDNEGANGSALMALSLAAGVGVGTLVDVFNGRTETIYSRGSSGSGVLIEGRPQGAALRWTVRW